MDTIRNVQKERNKMKNVIAHLTYSAGSVLLLKNVNT